MEKLLNGVYHFTFGTPDKLTYTSKGADVYLFSGENMLDAVQKYNMFAGGGACIPAWGLDPWYRMHGQSTSDDWIRMARRFR